MGIAGKRRPVREVVWKCKAGSERKPFIRTLKPDGSVVLLTGWVERVVRQQCFPAIAAFE
jgi:hypothetical protein